MNFTYSDSNKNKIEVYSLFVYSLYTIIMVILSGWNGASRWIGIFMTGGMLFSWIVYIGQFKNYRFRAAFYVIVMQCSLILHTSSLSDFTRTLPILMVFAVLVSLYGVKELLYIPSVGILIVFLIHVFLLDSFQRPDSESVFGVLAMLLNVGLMLRLLYSITRMNTVGSETLLGVIEELERVEQSKDDFIANVSHEIRTPLNTICGMSEVLLQKELPGAVQEDIQSIQNSGRMLMSVVRDILDFSELLSGKMELEEEAYSIASTINDIINMTSARRGNKPIELIIDCDPNIPCSLYGDEKKLRRVLMNLIDNAIKFTEEGCICISIGVRKESYGVNLTVSVRDTGIGIDEKDQEQLFTKYNQVDTGRNRQTEGLGLGLAISQALVTKMGGAITVKSRLGKGTSIRFTIPFKVLDERPFVALKHRTEVNTAVYIDMEKFVVETVRDEYERSIIHIIELLQGKCHICRNLAELQRREKRESLTHVFISDTEYLADKDYFDKLAEETNLVVVLDRAYSGRVTNPKVIKIFKPLYVLPIATVLNGIYDKPEKRRLQLSKRFVTENVRVLVVDDNRMNIMVMEALLSNYRIKVVTALSGAEALKKIASEDYDFVFMDHMMPEMDGVETLHRIRHLVGGYYRRVPVVALTANAVPGAREMFLGEGFQDFIEKPVEISVLERLLKRIIPKEKIVYLEEEAEEEKNLPSEVPEEDRLIECLEKYGLDVHSGLIYCNGKEYYIKILNKFCNNHDDASALADSLFKDMDWTNYTIAVHGIKGSMRSIGANKISELAKELELAGREGRIAFILDHHCKLMEEYRKLLEGLRGEKWLCPEGVVSLPEEEQVTEMTDLDEMQFAGMINRMEEAMYSLDEETFKNILEELKSCVYCNTALQTVLGPVQKKAESASFFSAVELLAELKKSLERKEKG